MTMGTTPSPTIARPRTMVENATQDGLAAPALAEDADRPAAVTIEDQRERAQQEFKRIWNLCTLMQ